MTTQRTHYKRKRRSGRGFSGLTVADIREQYAKKTSKLVLYCANSYGYAVGVFDNGKLIELWQDGNSPFTHGETLEPDDSIAITYADLLETAKAEALRLAEVHGIGFIRHDPIWGTHGDFTTPEYAAARQAVATVTGEEWRAGE